MCWANIHTFVVIQTAGHKLYTIGMNLDHKFVLDVGVKSTGKENI